MALHIVQFGPRQTNKARCRNNDSHARIGDYIVNGYCIPCYEKLGLKESTIAKTHKRINSNLNQKKRQTELVKWSKFRERVVALSCKGWKKKEINAALNAIKFQCYEQTWEERLKEIRNANGNLKREQDATKGTVR